jgi:hypothetical protein
VPTRFLPTPEKPAANLFLADRSYREEVRIRLYGCGRSGANARLLPQNHARKHVATRKMGGDWGVLFQNGHGQYFGMESGPNRVDISVAVDDAACCGVNLAFAAIGVGCFSAGSGIRRGEGIESGPEDFFCIASPAGRTRG